MTESEKLQLMQKQADAQFALTAAGQMVRTFETTQRIGKMYADSTIVPEKYQGNVANCAIAVDMAMHLGNGISPLTVMQNLVIVQGRPTWGAVFLIGCINTCGRFSTIRYDEKNLGKIGRTFVNKYVYENGKGTQKLVETDEYKDVDNLSCIAYAYDLATGDKLCSSEITIKMAMAEGWYAKSGSKWQTMPQQMLKYRSAANWQRAYAPEIGLGFHTTEEIMDSAPEGAGYEELRNVEAKTPQEIAMEEMKKKRKAEAKGGNPVIYPEQKNEDPQPQPEPGSAQAAAQAPTPFDEPENTQAGDNANANPKAGRSLT